MLRRLDAEVAMRDLVWPACWNVRDLGGIPLASGAATIRRRVVRAGNLSKLTEEGHDALRAYGVSLVIDLRDPREHAIELDPFHPDGKWHGLVAYLSAPLISEANWEALKDPKQRQRGNELVFDLSGPNVARVAAAIARAPDGTVVIHCHAGKERTGLIAAMMLALAGCPRSAIVDDYVASDAHLGPLYDEWARRESDPDSRLRLRRSFNSAASEVEAPLDWIEALGGIASYLATIGLSPRTIATLRARLTDEAFATPTE